jgi:D-alanyl-D-alanine carboxypeptidase/D-alanyl-D-alanine-endopeptidase (penicillin-binding protein 4)
MTDVHRYHHGHRPGRSGSGVATRSLRRVLSALATAAAVTAPSAQAQKGLAKRLDARLDAPPFAHQLWGVAVLDDKGKLLYGRNADRLFIPASNTKLIVTTVATALLPDDWTVKTSLYAAGPVVDGTVQGDLVLYGRGDPTFARRCYNLDTTVAGACDQDPFERLRVLAAGLKARGIRVIAGDLVGDGSYFEPLTVHPGWESYDLNWWYAAPVSGLGFNDNSLDLAWGPGAEDGPATVSITPDLGDVTLENRSRTHSTTGEQEVPFDFFREPGSLRLWVEGMLPTDARGATSYFALPDPNLFAARALRRVLAEASIAVLGSTIATTDSFKYRFAREGEPLAEVSSRPLRDWIFPILNTSQNWYAEMLLKQLGHQFGKAGSWVEGLGVERRFLIDSVGVDSTQFRLSDGSGLSSANLVTPLAFAKVLQFIRRHPRYPVFAAGLPEPGKPGTLKNRFIGTPLEGRVKAKTGTTELASTLSGYLITDSGRALTFSIQANHHTAPDRLMKAQLDSVVVDMARR